MPPSLELISASSIAKHVDLYNVIPIMIMAERMEVSFLYRRNHIHVTLSYFTPCFQLTIYRLSLLVSRFF